VPSEAVVECEEGPLVTPRLNRIASHRMQGGRAGGREVRGPTRMVYIYIKAITVCYLCGVPPHHTRVRETEGFGALKALSSLGKGEREGERACVCLMSFAIRAANGLQCR